MRCNGGGKAKRRNGAEKIRRAEKLSAYFPRLTNCRAVYGKERRYMDMQDILKLMQGGGDISSIASAMGGNMAALAPLLKNMQQKREDKSSSAPAAPPAQAVDLTFEPPIDE